MSRVDADGCEVAVAGVGQAEYHLGPVGRDLRIIRSDCVPAAGVSELVPSVEYHVLVGTVGIHHPDLGIREVALVVERPGHDADECHLAAVLGDGDIAGLSRIGGKGGLQLVERELRESGSVGSDLVDVAAGVLPATRYAQGVKGSITFVTAACSFPVNRPRGGRAGRGTPRAPDGPLCGRWRQRRSGSHLSEP